MQSWFELNSELKTYWYEAGVYDEEDYQEWIKASVISPAQLLEWKELGVFVPETVKLLITFGIRTPAELRNRLACKWKFGLPYGIQELIDDLFFDDS